MERNDSEKFPRFRKLVQALTSWSVDAENPRIDARNRELLEDHFHIANTLVGLGLDEVNLKKIRLDLLDTHMSGTEYVAKYSDVDPSKLYRAAWVALELYVNKLSRSTFPFEQGVWDTHVDLARRVHAELKQNALAATDVSMLVDKLEDV